MNETIKNQIMKVRDSGLCNMLDLRHVQLIAESMEFYDLVCYIEEHKQDYWNFIMTGKET